MYRLLWFEEMQDAPDKCLLTKKALSWNSTNHMRGG